MDKKTDSKARTVDGCLALLSLHLGACDVHVAQRRHTAEDDRDGLYVHNVSASGDG